MAHQQAEARIVEPIGALPLAGLLDSTGHVTPGERPASTLRLRNARVACALRLSGKRVLNLGCAWGIHSLYMARTAEEVVGVDHSASRIAIAESTRKALGISNVSFKCGDIRDPQLLDGVPKFDLVIAWGFLHRIADIFALLNTLSSMADCLSLEWRTPTLPFMSRLSMAYHPTTNRALNPRNIGPLRSKSYRLNSAAQAGSGNQQGPTGFWEPTPGAVLAIGRAFGFQHARILGYGENFHSGAKTVMTSWGSHLAKRMTGRPLAHQVPLARVHMILEKSPGLIAIRNPLGSDIRLPSWDLDLQKATASQSGS